MNDKKDDNDMLAWGEEQLTNFLRDLRLNTPSGQIHQAMPGMVGMLAQVRSARAIERASDAFCGLVDLGMTMAMDNKLDLGGLFGGVKKETKKRSKKAQSSDG